MNTGLRGGSLCQLILLGSAWTRSPGTSPQPGGLQNQPQRERGAAPASHGPRRPAQDRGLHTGVANTYLVVFALKKKEKGPLASCSKLHRGQAGRRRWAPSGPSAAGPTRRGRPRGAVQSWRPRLGCPSVLFTVILGVFLVRVLRRLFARLQQSAHVVVLFSELHLPLAHTLHLHGV